MKLVYVILIATVALFSSCSSDKAKEEKLKSLIAEREKLDKEIAELQKNMSETKNPEKFKTVKIIQLQPEDFKTYVKVQGRIDGDENVAANAKAMGVVSQIYVKNGDYVKKGQLLASLDDEFLQKSLAEINQQLEFARTVYEKQKRLWDQKIGSEMQYLSAKNNKEAMENRLKTLQEQIALYKIVSPINGTVEDVAIKVGQSVSPGFALLRVINLSKLKVVADVSEVYSAKINTGSEVEINFPDINHTINAKVTFSSKFINPLNRTFVVESALNNSDKRYSANMVAVLKINDYRSSEAIVLPVNYILTDQKGKYVFVAEKTGKKYVAKIRYIEAGATYNGKQEILKGLARDEMIIISNMNTLTNGETVKAI